ncbi:MAG: type 4a pilus biogenesis protein PilO [Acidimicrobiales bacterium]
MSRRSWIYIALGALVIVGAWYILLWGPVNDDLEEAEDRSTAAAAQLTSLDTELNSLKEQDANRPQLQSELEALRAGVPATPDEAEIILSVRAAAEASGVEFLDYNASPPAESVDGTLGEVRLELAGNGGYFQVLDFLNRINAEYRILVIDRISLNASSSEETFGPPLLTWQLSVRAFVQPEAAVLTSEEADAIADASTTTTETTTPDEQTEDTVEGEVPGDEIVPEDSTTSTTTAAGG